MEKVASSRTAFGDLLTRKGFHSETTKTWALWHPQSNPLMGLSLIRRASSLPQDRFCGEHWKPSWATGNVPNLFSAFKPGLPYQVHQSFFFFFLRKKNVNVLPICPGRINLHSHLKGLTTLFSLCRAGWVPCPGFLKRPSPSRQFPGLPLQWTWSKGKENRAAEPRGIKLKQQICFLASLLNTFRVFKAPKGNALGPWMWEAHLNPFPRGNLSPRWGKLAH